MIRSHDLYSTYSIVACDTEAGELGAAVQTHQMCVGSRVLWLEPGIGALATQSLANIAFGPAGMTMLRQGMTPEFVIAGLIASDPGSARRQVALVSTAGQATAFTGDRLHPACRPLCGRGLQCAGQHDDAPDGHRRHARDL